MSQRAVVIGGGAIGISPLAVVPKTPINVALSRRCRSRRFLQVFLMKPRTSSIDSILLNRAHDFRRVPIASLLPCPTTACGDQLVRIN